MKERLQKIFSSNGICSRRTAEEYLKHGRVTVNNTIAELGMQADPEIDVIALDGVPVMAANSRRTYILLNKPRGFVTTLSDEKGRKTVADLVQDCGVRVWPVGRLDLDSEGLLLLTNDGVLTNKLIHPRHGIEKEYLVWVNGIITPEILYQLSKPMRLDGQQLQAATVVQRGTSSVSITICEGKNRQVRRMCAAVGLYVTRLKRIREGELHLGDLPVGTWRVLRTDELNYLNSL